MYARLLVAMERERDFLVIAIASLVANVLLNLYWIPRIGIDGAAWATIVSYGLNVLLYYAYAWRRGVRVELRRSSMAPALALGAALLMSRMLDGEWTRAFMMLSAWLVVSLLLGAFHISDIRRALGAVVSRIR